MKVETLIHFSPSFFFGFPKDNCAEGMLFGALDVCPDCSKNHWELHMDGENTFFVFFSSSFFFSSSNSLFFSFGLVAQRLFLKRLSLPRHAGRVGALRQRHPGPATQALVRIIDLTFIYVCMCVCVYVCVCVCVMIKSLIWPPKTHPCIQETPR